MGGKKTSFFLPMDFHTIFHSQKTLEEKAFYCPHNLVWSPLLCCQLLLGFSVYMYLWISTSHRVMRGWRGKRERERECFIYGVTFLCRRQTFTTWRSQDRSREKWLLMLKINARPRFLDSTTFTPIKPALKARASCSHGLYQQPHTACLPIAETNTRIRRA